MTTSVYISSTSMDLKQYRVAVSEAVLKLGLYPITMENFGAQAGDALTVSLNQIRKADVVVTIIAHRYGYVPEGHDKSIIELEYDEAAKLGIPRLVYIIDPAYAWPHELKEVDPHQTERLADFKRRIDREVIRSLFTTPDNLANQVTLDLSKVRVGQQAQRRTRWTLSLVGLVGVLVVLIIIFSNWLELPDRDADKTATKSSNAVATPTFTPTSSPTRTPRPGETVTLSPRDAAISTLNQQFTETHVSLNTQGYEVAVQVQLTSLVQETINANLRTGTPTPRPNLSDGVQESNGGETTTTFGNVLLNILFVVVGGGVTLGGFFFRGKWQEQQNRAKVSVPVEELLSYRIFISYRRKNSWALARAIYEKLRASKADVFMDLEDINAGRFSQIIEREIKSCDHFILLLSPDTLDSTWVKKEILIALETKKKIIPVLTEGFTMDEKLPEDIIELANFNALTFSPEYFEPSMARLVRFIKQNAAPN